MKKLAVDLGELAFAFENASWMASHYLDTETGQVVMVTDETHSELEELYEEVSELDPESPSDLATFLEESDLHDWEKEALLEADQVEAGFGSMSREGLRPAAKARFGIRLPNSVNPSRSSLAGMPSPSKGLW